MKSIQLAALAMLAALCVSCGDDTVTPLTYDNYQALLEENFSAVSDATGIPEEILEIFDDAEVVDAAGTNAVRGGRKRSAPKTGPTRLPTSTTTSAMMT